MPATLEAHDKLIKEIFKDSCRFEIPYQHSYAWTTEQATELFSDSYSAMQEASNQYFTTATQGQS